jgi:hypothetical protein
MPKKQIFYLRASYLVMDNFEPQKDLSKYQIKETEIFSEISFFAVEDHYLYDAIQKILDVLEYSEENKNSSQTQEEDVKLGMTCKQAVFGAWKTKEGFYPIPTEIKEVSPSKFLVTKITRDISAYNIYMPNYKAFAHLKLS